MYLFKINKYTSSEFCIWFDSVQSVIPLNVVLVLLPSPQGSAGCLRFCSSSDSSVQLCAALSLGPLANCIAFVSNTQLLLLVLLLANLNDLLVLGHILRTFSKPP